jgi:uncharacterized protein (DUF305 family)
MIVPYENTMKILLIALLGAIALSAMGCGAGHGPGSDGHAQAGHNSTAMPADHGAMGHSRMDHSSMQSSPNAASAPYDLQFIDTMIAHHEAAVEMAKAIDGKAQHAELNALAKKIIAGQEKEIGQMKGWRDAWFAGAAPAVNMEMAGMAESMKDMDMKRLSTLSGGELDIEFIKQMVPHHVGATVMAEEARKRAQREEIKALADQIIKEQAEEIKQMRAWTARWSE